LIAEFRRVVFGDRDSGVFSATEIDPEGCRARPAGRLGKWQIDATAASDDLRGSGRFAGWMNKLAPNAGEGFFQCSERWHE